MSVAIFPWLGPKVFGVSGQRRFRPPDDGPHGTAFFNSHRLLSTPIGSYSVTRKRRKNMLSLSLSLSLSLPKSLRA